MVSQSHSHTVILIVLTLAIYSGSDLELVELLSRGLLFGRLPIAVHVDLTLSNCVEQ